MPHLLRENEKHSFAVCVDSCEKEWSGRFYDISSAEEARFENLVDLLTKMEKTLYQMQFRHQFKSAQEPNKIDPFEIEYEGGEVATIFIRIMFRRNSSWQGSILWVEGKREETFRSVLEMIFLMNDALKAQNDK